MFCSVVASFHAQAKQFVCSDARSTVFFALVPVPQPPVVGNTRGIRHVKQDQDGFMSHALIPKP